MRTMTLRNKFTALIIATLLGVLAVVYVASNIILLRGFGALEEREMHQNVERVLDTLQHEITSLDSQASDWSIWDESYAFVRSGDPVFVQKNLPPETFARLRLNLILYVDSAGRVVYGRSFDLDRAVATPNLAGIRQYLAAHPQLIRFSGAADGKAGIIMLANGPLLISSRPILTSAGAGPIRGALLMGRYLNRTEIAQVSDITHLALTLRGYGEPALPQDPATVRATVLKTHSVVRALGDSRIAGYALLRDLYGEPALLLRVAGTREIYQGGVATLHYFMAWLTGIGGAFAIVLHLLIGRLLTTRDRGRETEARYHAVVQQSGEGIFLVDADSKRLLDANAAFCRLLGYTLEELRAVTLYDLLGDDRVAVDQYVNRVLRERRHFTSEGQYRRKDDSWAEVEIGANIIVHAGKETLCIVARDIAERKRTQQRIEYLAHFDALTGLPNRILLRDRLQQTLEYARRHSLLVAVIFLDLDRFKMVNDTLGHPAGDLLLQAVAQRLTESVRSCDTVSRQGGDEFVIVMSEFMLPQECVAVAEKILFAVSQPHQINDQELHITTSIGISLFPGDGADVENLMMNADVAMYYAKKAGGNSVQLYSPSMNQRSFERLTLENNLRRALEREEFSLAYQPQVDLRTGRVFGMEALLRWQQPQLGQIPPTRFISIAEETGLIVPIGAWVLRTACQQARQWSEQGYGALRIAVNLSARQFQQKRLAATIAAILVETGLPANQLEIELTESMLMSNVAENIAALHALKALGVWISIDDFGTGYSSLAYLQRMPIDTVKIDRSFVLDISAHAEGGVIAKAVIALARSLHMSVIAEGVETVEQLDFLRTHGCDSLQGYYFSPPLAPDAFTRLLQEARCLPTQGAEGQKARPPMNAK
jgi:diguanylate cyclase (GGDEF)-like protein/PAS domain S-box-containing protein